MMLPVTWYRKFGCSFLPGEACRWLIEAPIMSFLEECWNSSELITYLKINSSSLMETIQERQSLILLKSLKSVLLKMPFASCKI